MKKITFLFFTIFTVAISSCENDLQPELESINKVERVFTNEDVYEIASLHNKYLVEVFSSFDYNNLDRKQELFVNFANFENKIGLNKDFKTSMSEYDKAIDCGLECIENFLNDDEAFKLILKVNNLENSGLIHNINELEKVIQEIKENAEQNISNGKNLDVVLVYLEVFKESARFWFPEDLGGSGEGYKIANNLHNNKYKSSIQYMNKISKGGKILAADATGAAGALIGGALFANADAIIAPPVFFGRVAFASAWSSGVAALM